MITLSALARLASRYADDLDRPVAPLLLGERSLDTDRRPAVMGVVNLSRDSLYRESVVTSLDSAIRRGRVLAAQGADVVDVGAESSRATAARVGPEEQIAGLVPVVRALAEDGIAVSVESYETSVVAAALDAGARVLNLTGSAEDAEMFDLAAEHGATVVLCHVLGPHARALDGTGLGRDPVPGMLDQFERRIADARRRGVRGIAIDPGLGFGFSLDDHRERARQQTLVLLNAFRLRRLGVPVCQSVPHSFELFEEQFRIGEGFFSVLAHLGGAGLYRTHEVPQVVALLDTLRVLDVTPD